MYKCLNLYFKKINENCFFFTRSVKVETRRTFQTQVGVTVNNGTILTQAITEGT